MKGPKKMGGGLALEDCTMYDFGQPDVQGPLARIPRVVIGCMNPKAGCAGSVLDMLHEEGLIRYRPSNVCCVR